MMRAKSKTPQIRFKGFSEEWKEKTLDDAIIDLYNGQTPSRIVNEFWNGNINWLSSGELNRSVVTKTIEKISVSGQKSANLRIVPRGTFVMAITGLEATGTRGNCAILGIDTTLNQSCMAIYPNPNLLHTHFLFQWYRKHGEEYGIKFTQGTKQQSYNAAIIRKLDITLPKVAEQTKIGDYFQNLDKLIEQKEQKYRKLRQFKTAMLSKMFPQNGAATPEIRFKGFSGEWEEKRLGELAFVKTGYPFESNDFDEKGEYLVITNGNIQNDSPFVDKSFGNRIDIENNSISSEYVLNINDILITMDGTVGRIAKVIEQKQILAQRVGRLTGMTEAEFIYHLLNTGDFFKKMTLVSHGGTIKHISLTEIYNYETYVPATKNEQTKIGNYFQHLDKLIDLHHQELDKLRHIKKASLEKMFV